MYNLNGKVALVTGAASKRGMGHAIAVRLAKEGADVAINDISQFDIRHSEDDRIEGWQGLKDVEAEITAEGRRALAMEADITSNQQVQEMVTRCIAKFGKIDILVNVAGIIGPRGVPTLDVSDNDWNQVLAVNLTGTFLCAKAVAKKMVEKGRGGKIINFASVAGKQAWEGIVSYDVAKSGVIALTQALAIELARHRIYVNAICPGIIATDLASGGNIRSSVRSGMSLQEAIAKIYEPHLKRIPLGWIGEAEDIAKMVAFLASSESDYITGQAINVCGGLLIIH